jgi:hypothetical protein
VALPEAALVAQPIFALWPTPAAPAVGRVPAVSPERLRPAPRDDYLSVYLRYEQRRLEAARIVAARTTPNGGPPSGSLADLSYLDVPPLAASDVFDGREFRSASPPWSPLACYRSMAGADVVAGRFVDARI